MESYEAFIQRHISQLRQCNIKSPEHPSQTNNSRSGITFYGCAILPPLLSLEQKEEMCRYRAVAKHLINERRRHSPRKSDSHTTVNSVQIIDSSTLRESILGQDVELTGKNSQISENSGHKQVVTKNVCSPVLLPTGLTDDWKVEDLSRPLMSAACDVSMVASLKGRPTVLKGCEGLEIQHLPLNPHSDVHQTLSTENVSQETPVGTSSNNNGTETERCKRETSSSMDFILQNHANTISLDPSVIYHVPVDGDALEECMVDTPSQVEGSLQTHIDQASRLSGVGLSVGPCRIGSLRPKTQEHPWEQQTLQQDRKLRVLSPAEDECLSDKENKELSDVVGRGEHKRDKAKRQEQGRVQTPEAEKGQFDWTMEMIPFEKLCNSRGLKKFKTVPIPQLCLSPVSCKKGGKGNHLRKPEMNKHVESKAPLSWSNPACQGSGSKSGVAGGIALGRSPNQAQQIAQLELNLSSLKMLISDLESSLSEAQTDLEESTEVSAEYLYHDQFHSSPVQKTKKSRISENASHLSDKEQPQSHQAVPQEACTIATKECQKPLLSDTSNKLEQKTYTLKMTGPEPDVSLKGVSLNQSYDVESPSGLLLQAQLSGGRQFSPCTDSHGVVFNAKRRLVMKAVDSNASSSPD